LAEIQALLSKDGNITKILQKAAENRWSCAQLEVEMKVGCTCDLWKYEYVIKTSHNKNYILQDAGIEPSSIETFLNVWRKEEAKVVAHIRDKSYWGPKLQRLAWYVMMFTGTTRAFG
jgi:hypothetical protein